MTDLVPDGRPQRLAKAIIVGIALLVLLGVVAIGFLVGVSPIAAVP